MLKRTLLLLFIGLFLISFASSVETIKYLDNADGTSTKYTYNSFGILVKIETVPQYIEEEQSLFEVVNAKKIMAEQFLTKSLVPNFATNYFKFFYLKNLSEKTTHYANIKNSYLDMEERVVALEGVITLLLNELCLSNTNHTFCDVERKEEIVSQVEPYKQPTGAHDAYKIGDKVSWNGGIYKSKINANVWSPTSYPAGWEKIL